MLYINDKGELTLLVNEEFHIIDRISTSIFNYLY